MLIAAYPVGWALASQSRQIIRIATLAFVGTGTLTAAVSMYQLFPYQYSFYNMLVGGISGADGRYEIDVWRAALREALSEIAEKPQSGKVVRIGTCGSALNFASHPTFRHVQESEEADYIVILRRCLDLGISQNPNLPIIGSVRRQGVLLAAIYSRVASCPQSVRETPCP
jgi:hypothetical protein